MKIAIVTGASSGMGAEFIRQIYQSYPSLDEIWMIARRKEAMDALAGEFLGNGIRLRSIPLDLTKDVDIQKLQDLLQTEKPKIRLLVNGAGVGHYGKAAELSIEQQTRMIDLNCKALTRVTLLCLPYMPDKSRILQLASGSAFLPQARFAVYAAGKSYVVSFSKALHKELKNRQITVTSACPGPVDTEFFANGEIDLPAWKKPFLVQPDQVVKKALKDAQAGKTLSIYGLPMKLVYVASHFI